MQALFIGCGEWIRWLMPGLLKRGARSRVEAVCEPNPRSYEKFAGIFRKAGRTPPPNDPDLGRLLKTRRGKLDAAYIISPHAFHHDQAVACMEAGLDVLVEKPMVMNAREALSLMRVRRRTGRLLVVGFPGSLSPQIRGIVAMMKSGRLGRLLAIEAVVWQNWADKTAGTWRQDPRISGGGFVFDTGAHMLNTVADLAGEDFATVAAWLDNNGRRVETMGTVMARLRSGALVTMAACGEAIPSCESEVRIFCEKAVIRTGVWGEKLEIRRPGGDKGRVLKIPPLPIAWELFLDVRAGRVPNPCPPEAGLRMARLYDAIRKSARLGGRPVRAG